jgi:hypothetical protein
MEIATIFTAGKAALSIATYLGVLDSVDAKIDRLAKADFNTALRALREARSASQENQLSLIRDASSGFRRALSLESDARLAMSYLGLAMCQHLLGEETNARSTLGELSRYELPETAAEKVLKYGQFVSPILQLGHLAKSYQRQRKVACINAIKLQASTFLKATGEQG